MTHDPMCPMEQTIYANGHTVCIECACDLIAKVRADERDKGQGSIDATLTLFSQDIRSLDNCVGDHEARLRTIEQILLGES